jgi:hypothetical protein
MIDRWGWLAPVCRMPLAGDSAVTIEETTDDGRAEVTFTAPPGWRIEKLALERCAFTWLEEQFSADGILLARPSDGSWQAHVVECKRTVTDGKWQKVQRQLRGSCLRLLAVNGVLGLELGKITLYTAFRRESISARTPDFTLATPPPGRTGTNERFAQRLAWQAGTLAIDGFGPLEHHRIQLEDRGDDVGRATVSLGSSP